MVVIHSSTDYARFCDFLEQTCGIRLGADKAYLVRNRLDAILKKENIKSLGALVDGLQGRGSWQLERQVVDAMTTNETLWFRDGYPFDLLSETLLPDLSGKCAGTLRIWSAACSRGQEAYSISLVLEAYRNRRHLPGVQIIATDICCEALAQAEAAVYDRTELKRGLPPQFLQYFLPEPQDRFRVCDRIREHVDFRRHNLLHGFSGMGKFDIVFLRNVLIYFSECNKRDVISRVARVMNPGGYLVLGASESLPAVGEHFTRIPSRSGILWQLNMA